MKPSKSYLSVASWNVRGIQSQNFSKLDDETFLKEISKHDIIALQETHMKLDMHFHIPGYIVYQANRPQAHGGVAFVIKEEFKNCVESIKAKCNDLLWLRLKKEYFKLQEDIYLCSVYISPSNSTYSKKCNASPYEFLESEVCNYSSKGKVVLLGDFNSRTNNYPDYIVNDDSKFIPVPNNYVNDHQSFPRRSQDTKCTNCKYGKELLEFCKVTGMRIANGRVFGDPVGKYTCHQYNGSSVVDYVLCDSSTLCQMRYFIVEDLIGDLSDHCKLSLSLKISGYTLQSDPTSLTKQCVTSKIATQYIWGNDSSQKIQEALSSPHSQHIIDTLCKSDINNLDETIESLTNLMHDCASQCLRKRKGKQKSKKSRPWFNVQCSRLKQEVRKLGKQLCKDPTNVQLRTTFYNAKRNFKHAVKVTKQHFKNTLTNELEFASQNDPKKYWNLLKMLKASETQNDTTNPIPADEWIKHFTEIYKSPAMSGTLEEEAIINELKTLENTKIFNELSFRFTMDEVKTSILQLKPGKTPGIDGIQSEIIKASCTIIAPVLVKIFNYMLQEGKYPSSWMLGIISPIHKKGSPYITDNYRGITVTNTLSKVFGILMNTRLKEFCIKHSIIDDRQSSHKEGARTVDNVLIIKSLFEKYCIKGKSKLHISFIDFRKAFDSIWHEGLFLKLLKNEIGGPFYQVLKSMYNKSTSMIKLNGGLTSKFRIQSGVRQGDILSPLLFNIFINDIVKEFHDTQCHAPSLIDQNIGCLLYADDLIIMSTTQHGLQYSLDKLAQYCTKWKLQVNLSKSKLMCMSKSRKMPTIDGQIFGNRLEQVQSYPYLGVELSWNGTFRTAEKTMTSKAQKAMFKLRTLLYGSDIKPSISLKLFDQLVKPVCLYGSEIWIMDAIKFDDDEMLAKSLESILSEKVNISFSKFILSVHGKAQNTAVRGELGRLPLGIDAVANAILYYNHIERGNANPLLLEALAMSKSKIKNSWANKTQQLLTYIQSMNTKRVQMTRKNIKTVLKNLYEKFWLKKIAFENKMRTYRTFKHNLTYEKYLDIVKAQHRKCLTRFRISAHNLAIERGRYQRPPTPINERVCPHCPHHIQDEHHFLLNCKQHMQEREDLQHKITALCPLFQALSPINQFLFMLSAEGEIIKNVACFIYNHLP